jgi:hypothetical protein
MGLQFATKMSWSSSFFGFFVEFQQAVLPEEFVGPRSDKLLGAG